MKAGIQRRLGDAHELTGEALIDVGVMVYNGAMPLLSLV